MLNCGRWLLHFLLILLMLPKTSYLFIYFIIASWISPIASYLIFLSFQNHLSKYEMKKAEEFMEIWYVPLVWWVASKTIESAEVWFHGTQLWAWRWALGKKKQLRNLGKWQHTEVQSNSEFIVPDIANKAGKYRFCMPVALWCRENSLMFMVV